MDRHACKLCFRTFSTGRALGGHMRSHAPPPAAAGASGSHLIEHSASLSSSSSANQRMQSYVLRENPKKSFRLVDPEFSLAGGCSSAIVQDWESETESPPATFRRRTRRRRRFSPPSPPKSEPVSSVSETTPDEDVARCLMMLSRDAWTKTSVHEEDEESEKREKRQRREKRGKYNCGTCGKIFRSYQALGGHRASHKRLSTGTESQLLEEEEEEGGERRWGDQIHGGERRIHECPVCFRVFSSGQALGGHKRSHLVGSSSGFGRRATSGLASNSIAVASGLKLERESLLDLNELPPMDEGEETSEEISAVSEEQEFA